MAHFLTTAHCTSFSGQQADTVRVGDIDLKSTLDDKFAQQKRIVKIVRHPNYRDRSNYHDIAVLEVDSDLK
jgi:hypothetical protein